MKTDAAFNRSARPARPAMAAAAYWTMIFALGFVLGTIRTVWGAEAIGEATFILVEVPLMLLASWLSARWLVQRFTIANTGSAMVMGALAFALLMLAEMALTTALGGDAVQWLINLATPPELYGFLGQIAFGLMPWVIVRLGHR